MRDALILDSASRGWHEQAGFGATLRSGGKRIAFMRPWLVGLIVFAGAYAGASLAGVPWLCRNPQYAEMLGFVRACARPGGLPASKMALIYFASVGLGLLVAIIVERFSRPAPEKAEKKEEAAAEQNAVAAIEEILPEETAALQAAAVSAPEPVQQPAQPPVSQPVAHPSALQAPVTPPPATPVMQPASVTPQATPVVQPSVVAPPPVVIEPSIEPGKPAPASMIKVTPPAVAPRPAPVIPAVTPPPPVAAAPVIPPPVERPVPPPPPEPMPSFHDDAEFLKKIWGLDAMDAEMAAEQGGRYVDESVLSAIHYGTDPKMHLSKLAQLMLQQDPDLKSPGVRGVVKHIALRLRELGVAPGSAVNA